MSWLAAVAAAYCSPSLPGARPVSVLMAAAPLAERDTVAVVGASGNVGRLVALRLSERFHVRGIVRDKARAAAFLGDRVELFEADLNDLPLARAVRLQAALSGAHAVVLCTGTTAFPTQAWSLSGENDVTGAVVSALVRARFSVRDAIAALDGEGLCTPKNIDEKGTTAVLEAWAAAAGSQRKRFDGVPNSKHHTRLGLRGDGTHSFMQLEIRPCGAVGVRRDTGTPLTYAGTRHSAREPSRRGSADSTYSALRSIDRLR